jgi:hypothetical protein
MYMESHNETLYTAILNKQKFIIFYRNREQEGKTGPVWGVGTTWEGEDIREGYTYGITIMYSCM